MLPNELLEKIAAAYEGKTSADQLKLLEKELNALPDGLAEASAYHRLWDGFAALRVQQFRVETTNWEQEASAHDDEELVEWYLAQELHPDQQKQLDQRKANDPGFAKIVNEQQQLQTGFGALKTENFREQLTQWEKEQPTEAKIKTLRPQWIKPLSIAAGFLLLLAVSGNWYSQNNYSGAALASNYYKTVPTGNTLGGEEERIAYLENFDAAHQAIKKGEYAVAASTFEQLTQNIPPAGLSDEDLKYYQDNIDWNLILSRLGAGNTLGDFDLRLKLITQDTSHTYHKQAVALQQDLNSFWYW